jgi:hypothetical protein
LPSFDRRFRSIFAGFALLSYLTCFVSAALAEPVAKAEAGGAVEYEKTAQKQFAQAKYKDAAASLRLAIYKGSKSPAAWLLLGQCYEKSGELGAARQTYQTVQKYFPSSAECAKAALLLGNLPPPIPVSVPRVAPEQKISPAPAMTAVTVTKPGVKKELKDRIYLVPPRWNHQAVSPHTVSLVRSLVAGLPAPVYKILDQGNANIYLTPNLIDRFPEGVGTRNENLGRYFADQLGRTYGRDVYLCERWGGKDTDLGPVSNVDTLKEFFYTFMAHSLNDCLEMPSKDPQFLQMYNSDAATGDLSQDPKLRTFFSPVEGVNDTFAALAASIMGSNTSSSEMVSRSFPRCRAWIAQRIKILSNHLDK